MGHEHEIEKSAECPHCAVPAKKWYRERLNQIFIVTFVVLASGLFFPAMRPVLDAWIDYFSLIWWALLLGFLLGGAIDYFVPEHLVERHLKAKKKRTILKAVILGFLMSACSHGILAIAMELYKKGASTASTVAFLLASPWANLPITVLLFGFFGPKAFLIILSAIIIAVITGIIFQFLEHSGRVEGAKKKPVKETRLQKKGKKETPVLGILRGSWNLTKMVLWWILIGMLLASLARAFIPTEAFHQFLGPTLLGLFLTLAFATIIEVCSEGSAPLSFEIFRQTGALGNSFVFLMAGVVTDYTEIGLVWSNIGKRAAVWLVIVSVPQVLLLGWLFNLLL